MLAVPSGRKIPPADGLSKQFDTKQNKVNHGMQ